MIPKLDPAARKEGTPGTGQRQQESPVLPSHQAQQWAPKGILFPGGRKKKKTKGHIQLCSTASGVGWGGGTGRQRGARSQLVNMRGRAEGQGWDGTQRFRPPGTAADALMICWAKLPIRNLVCGCRCKCNNNVPGERSGLS